MSLMRVALDRRGEQGTVEVIHGACSRTLPTKSVAYVDKA